MGECEMRLEDVFEDYYSYLVGMLINKGVDEWLAEDCVQQVFLHLVESGKTPDSEGALPSWLGRCVINRHGEHIRKESIRSALWVGEDEAPERGYEWSPGKAQLEQSSAKQAQAAWEELTDSEREIVFLYYFENKTDIELASHYGVHRCTVKSRARRARTKLINLIHMEEPNGRYKRYPSHTPDYHRVWRVKRSMGKSAA